MKENVIQRDKYIICQQSQHQVQFSYICTIIPFHALWLLVTDTTFAYVTQICATWWYKNQAQIIKSAPSKDL